MSESLRHLTLPCDDTEEDYVTFSRLVDSHAGCVALVAYEDGAQVVIHLAADSQVQLRDWLSETLAESTKEGETP